MKNVLKILALTIILTGVPAQAAEDSLRPLTDAVLSGTPAEKVAAAKALAAKGPAAKAALPDLIRAISQETDETVGPQLVGALSAIGLGEPSEIDQLVRVIKEKPNGGPAMRCTIRLINWIKSGHADASKAIVPLGDLLASEHAGNRAAAAIALGSAGVRAKDILPKLAERYAVEKEDDVKVYLIGAYIGINDQIDPLCGHFEAEGIKGEFHRIPTGKYEGRIIRNGVAFPATGTVENGVLSGTFEREKESFPFAFRPTESGYELQSGKARYAVKRVASK